MAHASRGPEGSRKAGGNQKGGCKACCQQLLPLDNPLLDGETLNIEHFSCQANRRPELYQGFATLDKVVESAAAAVANTLGSGPNAPQHLAENHQFAPLIASFGGRAARPAAIADRIKSGDVEFVPPCPG